MKMQPVIVVFIWLFLMSTTLTNAGDYGATIDAQSRVMRQIMQDFTAVQGSIATYWRNMPERERYLRHTANEEVDSFKQQTGRYPTNNDVYFIRTALNKAKVRNQTEAELMIRQMSTYIRGSSEFDDINNTICRAARAQGFTLADCP